ncbi:MAG: bifunctional 5,10-methylenetetrahydrofolate dehydrogenase/5,10-methenyltetrahydrofolate cyclohydrolase [Candidatus Paceibacterota bacterium]|jgi:methylenetetrahydrofolate dehydrogenase (NADP+)/methenyltetrahydrofolate cyclohydrolase
MQIIDGKKLRVKILEKVKSEVASLAFQPVFCDVLVGGDPSSAQYVKMKAKTAESVGIKFHNADFPESITTDELIKEIKILNKVKNMCGIIIQLPLPEHLDKSKILNSIDSHLDVDCLGDVASEKFYNDYNIQTDLGYPTALACMALLDSIDLDLDPSTPLGAGKKIVVLGQGMLVGKPVSALLKYRGLNPIIIRSKTPDKEQLIKEADIIISGMGSGKYLTGNMVKKGVVIIDAGTSEEVSGSLSGQGRVNIVGDVDLESVKDVAGYVSPVPGGVGPVTVAMLLSNVLKVAKSLNK